MSIVNKFLRENKVSKMTKTERNAWYNALSKPEKAVAVCEDVLLQIKNKKYIMTEGTYVQLELDSNITQRTVNDILKKEALDELVAAKSVTCNVCAIGSTFMSCVRLGNDVNTDLLDISADNRDYYGDIALTPGDIVIADEHVAFDKLSEVFTKKEYRAMEFMFEDASDINYTFNTYDEEEALVKEYDTKYSILSAEDKMIKMCKQIIKDKGYFLVEGVDLGNKDK